VFPYSGVSLMIGNPGSDLDGENSPSTLWPSWGQGFVPTGYPERVEMLVGIGILLLGAAWVVTSLMCIAGMTRDWARAKPTINNLLARNFMPYTFLGLGLVLTGLSPQLVFANPPDVVSAVGGILVLLGIPIGIISMIHWPLFLSPPWYRRWYQRGGRMANNVPLWEPHGNGNPAHSSTRA
jgi:hypothetical protein